MSLYHFHVDQKSRGKGQSVVASAAYISGEKLHDNYYGEDPDYRKKGGVLYSEIFLPENVPKKFSDRETLWNEVEKNEKHPKAQLAYSFDIALQNELSDEENISLAKQFVEENFVSKGMIVDMAVHKPDKGKGGIPNPHFHVLSPIRPITSDGKWGAKQRREYVLDDDGNRIKNENGDYIFNAVATTDWGTPDTLLLWRKNWAELVNETFAAKGIDERIDYRSYLEQGISTLPTIHEGPIVRAMEAKGIETEKGNYNRMIVATSRLIEKLYSKLKQFVENMSELRAQMNEIKEQRKADASEHDLFVSLVTSYFNVRSERAYSNKARVSNLQRYVDTVAFLKDNSITTFDELVSNVSKMYSDVSSIRSQIKNIENEKSSIEDTLHYLRQYKENSACFEKSKSISGKKEADKYKEAHHGELTLFYVARRKLWEKYPDKIIPERELHNRLDELTANHDSLYKQYNNLKEKASMAYTVKKSIESEYKKIKDSQNTSKTKRKDRDR